MFVLATILSLAVQSSDFQAPQGDTVEAKRILADALANADQPEKIAADRLVSLKEQVAESIKRLQPYSPCVDALTAAMNLAGNRTEEEQFARMRQAVANVLAELTFEPVAEAELPKGFPTYTPVGTIEVKQYPAYRMAAGPGFWTLFKHIQSNGIAMTAPVQMSYHEDKLGKLEETGMAFLYRNDQTGSLGRQGKVNVVDNAPQTVVSIGMRGRRSVKSVTDAEQRLRAWIDASGDYKDSGDVRLMGYNSPYIPPNKQFFELQIPVTNTQETTPATDAP